MQNPLFLDYYNTITLKCQYILTSVRGFLNAGGMIDIFAVSCYNNSM